MLSQSKSRRRRVRASGIDVDGGGRWVGACGLHMVGVPPRGEGNQLMTGRSGTTRVEASHVKKDRRDGDEDEWRRDVSHPDFGTASLWGMSKTPTARSHARDSLTGTRWIAS